MLSLALLRKLLCFNKLSNGIISNPSTNSSKLFVLKLRVIKTFTTIAFLLLSCWIFSVSFNIGSMIINSANKQLALLWTFSATVRTKVDASLNSLQPLLRIIQINSHWDGRRRGNLHSLPINLTSESSVSSLRIPRAEEATTEEATSSSKWTSRKILPRS